MRGKHNANRFWIVVFAAALVVGCIGDGMSGRGKSGRQNPPGGAVAPSPPCTMIGCRDGLTIQLRPGSGWPAGDYRFQIRTDEFELSCRGSLPLASCIGSADPSALRNVSCDVEGLVQIGESGCALPAAAHGFPDLVFDPKIRPRQVDIRITRDGRLVGEANFVPRFQRQQPNGPGCAPICDGASAVVDLHFQNHRD